jgi:hypothetical protein
MKKRKIAALAVVAVLAIAGAAFAYWTANGSGSGSGSVSSTATELTLHGTITSPLSPGGKSSVTYTADNTSGSSEYVGTVHPEVSIDEAHATAGCKVSDFTIGDTVEKQVIAAGATATELTHAGSISMADTEENQDACQGAIVSLSLSTN